MTSYINYIHINLIIVFGRMQIFYGEIVRFLFNANSAIFQLYHGMARTS